MVQAVGLPRAVGQDESFLRVCLGFMHLASEKLGNRQVLERDGKLDRQIAELEAWLAIHDPRPEVVEDEA